jgi:hypothetical protein
MQDEMKARFYDRILLELAATRRLKPEDANDFSAVLSALKPKANTMFGNVGQIAANMAATYQELVASMVKVGVITQDQANNPSAIRNAILAPTLAGKVSPEEDAVALAKIGDFSRLEALGVPVELMKSTSILGRIGELLDKHNLRVAPTILDSLKVLIERLKTAEEIEARIFQTLLHYGKVSSSSAVQSIKDLCDEHETIVSVLTKRGLEPDRLKEMVLQGINEFDRLQMQYEALHEQRSNIPRDAADAQDIATFMSEFYPTENHSLPNAVRALFENYTRYKQLGDLFTDESETGPGCKPTDTFEGLRWALTHVINERNEFRAEVKRGGVLTSIEEPMFLEMLRAYVTKSRFEQPQKKNLVSCLEGATSVAKTAVTSKSIGEVIEACVAVAGLAYRLAEEGDRSWNDARKAKGLSKFKKTKGECIVQSFTISVPITFAESNEKEAKMGFDFSVKPSVSCLAVSGPNGVNATHFAVDEASAIPPSKAGQMIAGGAFTNPNHPETALARIGKALVEAGLLDPEEATSYSECAFGVEVLIENKKKGDQALSEAYKQAAEARQPYAQAQTTMKARLGSMYTPSGVVADFEFLYKRGCFDLLIQLDQRFKKAGHALDCITPNADAILLKVDKLLANSTGKHEEDLVKLSFIVSPDRLLTPEELIEQVSELKKEADLGSFRKARREVIDILTSFGHKVASNQDIINTVRGLVMIDRDSKKAREALAEVGKMLSEAVGGHDKFDTPSFLVAGVQTMLKRNKEGVENWHEIGGLLVDAGFIDKCSTLTFRRVFDSLSELIRRNRLQGEELREAVKFRDEVFADMKERGVVTSDGRPTNATLRGGVDNLLSKLEHALAFPSQVVAFLLEQGLFNSEWPSTPEQIRAAITEVVLKLQKREREFGELSFTGPQHLFHLLSDAGVMDTFHEADLPSLEEGIKRLIAERKEAKDDTRAVYDELNKTKDEIAAEKAVTEKIQMLVGEVANLLMKTFPGRTLLDPPSIVNALEMLILNYNHARDIEFVLEGLGAEYTGTLAAKVNRLMNDRDETAKRNNAQKDFILKIESMVKEAGKSTDGTLPSIWAAVRDCLEALAKKDGVMLTSPNQSVFMGLPKTPSHGRLYANGRRVFVHYFEESEYLGQFAAHIRGGQFVSGFGWFYMVEFEQPGIGGHGFDYAESRIDLSPEAVHENGDVVTINGTEDRVIIDAYHYDVDNPEGGYYQARWASDGKSFRLVRNSEITSTLPLWEVYKQYEPRVLVAKVHASTEREAEKRAAKRLSLAGVPTTFHHVRAKKPSGRKFKDGDRVSFIETAGRDNEIGTVFALHDENDPNGLLYELRTKDGESRLRFEADLAPAPLEAVTTWPLFNHGQRVSFLPVDGPLAAGIVKDVSVITPYCYEVDVDGEKALVQECMLSPAPRFKNGDSVTVTNPNNGEKRDAKVVGSVFNEWSGEWVCDVNLKGEFGTVERWEKDLAPRTEAPSLEEQRIARRPKPKFKAGDSVLVQPGNRPDKVTEAPVFSSHKNEWSYSVEGESGCFVLESYLRPAPLYKLGEEVMMKGTAVWVVTSGPDWTDRKETYLYGAQMKDGRTLTKTTVGGMSESELRPAPTPVAEDGRQFEKGDRVLVDKAWPGTVRDFQFVKAYPHYWKYEVELDRGKENGESNEFAQWRVSVLPEDFVFTAFLAASRALQDNADKMVGKRVQVARDAKEQAIRDGAINPDWLQWVELGVAGRSLIVTSASISPEGEVRFGFDKSGFQLSAKYTDGLS